jgi:hypothetical protein
MTSNAVCLHVYRCDDADLPIDISPVHLTVDVQETKMAEIVLEGGAVHSVPAEQLTHGCTILPDVIIHMSQKDTNDGSVEAVKPKVEQRLDSCMIRVEPSLKTDIEQLTYPANLLAQLALEAYDSDKGLVLAGECMTMLSVVHCYRTCVV